MTFSEFVASRLVSLNGKKKKKQKGKTFQFVENRISQLGGSLQSWRNSKDISAKQ